ncbi:MULTISPECIES: LuxR family transcriptional regulator [Xanthomonas]|uniref:LuxR family transcriptional regulator n=1 Tax=Xanthomonas cucurbitae TaxID=56453 RepID=A0A2S7DPM5_9XANT|nr:LuxR family transcriptional regulator [Xanthomonas cucurbitae]PPU75730.1 LuxR family transcriptional regulator [Xanthomonas cucurbitae]QHG87707.1 LuxR family transcriptional regulator [Xanthomonas cucurbitae]WDM66580.1 LuxR family transcriptional regulator [Xanthomonas cucurbitae]WDM70459.1 LuxR family transcriptional regulator [Xanthomonas cucurbitae]WDM74325.1 LuxR family transcriptional regulator [Xanthomonas cucurbitae]
MFDSLIRLGYDLQARHTLDACLDRVFDEVCALGFQSLVYDYAPVPLSVEGALMTPTVFMQRNAPGDMQHVWCEHGYYQHDPVQRRATGRSASFVWSYCNDGPVHGMEYVGGQHRQVTRYLCENGMATGITVPLHLPGGAFATFSAVISAPAAEAPCLAEAQRSPLLLLAHAFQARAQELMDPQDRRCHHIVLTRRERECLHHAAKGLTAKGIAAALNRSTATVNLHLNSAARKLGARNRVEAVVRSMHYRLLEP